jgi:hypothetical protein
MMEYSSTAEQLPFKQLVRGSNPRAPTKNNMIRITKKNLIYPTENTFVDFVKVGNILKQNNF